jgi:hypothetical protein
LLKWSPTKTSARCTSGGCPGSNTLTGLSLPPRPPTHAANVWVFMTWMEVDRN